MLYYCSDSQESQIHRGPRPFQHFIRLEQLSSYNLSVSYSYLLPELTRVGLMELARPQNESRLHGQTPYLYFYQLALRVLGKLYYFKCMSASPVYLVFARCLRNPGVRVLRTGVTHGCESLCGTETQTQVLWKDSQCSSMLHRLSNPSTDIF